jgi:indolepyruvate ferredoxin oxidoreductase alpha subunit
MTGHQPNPATGMKISGEPGTSVDIEALCRAIGVKHIHTVNPHNLAHTEKILKQEIDRPEPSVVITQYPCVLLPEMKKRQSKPLYTISSDSCTGCRACLKIGCPAIEWVPLSLREAKELGFKPKQKGYARINSVLCDGCAQCVSLCKFGAILLDKGDNE